MSKAIYADHRKKMMDQLGDGLLVLFAGEAPHKRGDDFYPFDPDKNFYYMTGIDQPKLIYTSFKSGGQCQETLFIERFDELVAKWDGAVLSEEEARKISGIQQIKYLDEFYETFAVTMFKSGVQNVYLDLEKREWGLGLSPSLVFAKELKDRYPAVSIVDVYQAFGALRQIKDSYEVDKIRKAIQATKAGIYKIFEAARPGISETELEAYFSFGFKLAGGQDYAFDPIIAGGKNATVLHYKLNGAKIKDKELVLLDLGARYEQYHGDISRTFPVNGKYSKRQKELYNVVLEGQQKVIDSIKPGIPFQSLNETLVKYYAKKLCKIGLIQSEKEVSEYYYHGVSHFLGLETHDIGRYREGELKPGMVLTVEPGLYIAKEKIGIRIEDNILVTEDGYENLSADIIKTTDEIESFMRDRA